MATREQSIYIAYKAAVRARRKDADPNAEVLAIVDVSNKLRVSALLVLNIVKAREPKKT